MKIGFLKRKIRGYLSKNQLTKGKEFTRLEKPFLIKARKNFTVANMLMRISDKDDLKKVLSLPSGLEMYDWAIIVAYYSMYASALAALAKLGFKSRSHAASLAVLEYNYVHQKRGLEIRHLDKLSKAYALSEELINKLIQTKMRRETAQYDATPSIYRESAVSSLGDADEFITRIEEILS
jgi:uncharacterized protein (UPF0332 family)